MNENHRILILLNYFERPGLVKGFLRSLVEADRSYANWELAFIDDGSREVGRPIVERILKDLSAKVKFYNSEMTGDMKKLCGGSYMGLFMNRAMKESDADICIMAGDDDEMCPDYLRNLDDFFAKNPDVSSCYSNVHVFDPLKEIARDTHNLYSDNPGWKGHAWFGRPINPAYKVDGIQLAFRMECFRIHGAKFKYPLWINHDAEFFQELHDRCGPSVYTGFVCMYKGRHDGQLIHRVKDNDPWGSKKKVIDRPKDVLFL